MEGPKSLQISSKQEKMKKVILRRAFFSGQHCPTRIGAGLPFGFKSWFFKRSHDDECLKGAPW